MTAAASNDTICRHCEPTGPAFGRPDDRLGEAISPHLVTPMFDSAISASSFLFAFV
jgi:hypothetical protein